MCFEIRLIWCLQSGFVSNCLSAMAAAKKGKIKLDKHCLNLILKHKMEFLLTQKKKQTEFCFVVTSVIVYCCKLY